MMQIDTCVLNSSIVCLIKGFPDFPQVRLQYFDNNYTNHMLENDQNLHANLKYLHFAK